MKKIMISQGLGGITDLQNHIQKTRYAVLQHYISQNEPVEILETHFPEFTGNRVEFLGKSIQHGIALADEIVFVNEWINYDSCRCERFIADVYKIPYIVLQVDL